MVVEKIESEINEKDDKLSNKTELGRGQLKKPHTEKELSEEMKDRIILYSFKSVLWLRIWKKLYDIEKKLFALPNFEGFFYSHLKGSKELDIKKLFEKKLSPQKLSKLILFDSDIEEDLTNKQKDSLNFLKILIDLNAITYRSSKRNGKFLIILNSRSPKLTQVTQLLNEKGLMVVRNALYKLSAFIINGNKYKIVEIKNNKYRITEQGLKLWDILFEQNKGKFTDISKVIEKYIDLINNLRNEEKKFSKEIRKSRKYLLKLNNVLNDEILKFNKNREELEQKIKSLKEVLDKEKKTTSIEDLEDIFLEYYTKNKKLKEFDILSHISEQGKELNQEITKDLKNLLLYESRLNIITRDLRVMNDVEEIEQKINESENEFSLLEEEIEENSILKEDQYDKYEDFLSDFEKFKKNFV